MVTIEEYDRVKLKNGEVARIVEIYEQGVSYEAEIFRRSDGFSITIDIIKHDEIATVIKDVEYNIA